MEKKKYGKKALEIFRSTLQVKGIKFVWKIKPTDSFFWFKSRLEGERFDSIAWAVQTWVEELMTKWVKNCVKKFKISNVTIAGGVALNIKAIGKISQIKQVKKIFVGGSASDESMALSAGIYLMHKLYKERGEKFGFKKFPQIPNLYLGPSNDYIQEKKSLKKLNKSKFKIYKKFTLAQVAKFLSKGKVIARCAGRMEFGQRALGNRSILADPRFLDIKEKINSAIKNRDFWMPFAPVILKKFSKQYLVNPKNIESPHMTVGFETTNAGYQKMPAACHPADKTARAQILKKKDNLELYKLIEEFHKITGVGALLNTSFNLHGYPIANTPKDAILILKNSNLDGLVFNNFFIIKK